MYLFVFLFHTQNVTVCWDVFEVCFIIAYFAFKIFAKIKIYSGICTCCILPVYCSLYFVHLLLLNFYMVAITAGSRRATCPVHNKQCKRYAR